mgnify:CR=1 FL=1
MYKLSYSKRFSSAEVTLKAECLNISDGRNIHAISGSVLMVNLLALTKGCQVEKCGIK